MQNAESGIPSFRCLLVDDDEDDICLIESHLRDISSAAVTVQWESDFDAALVALRDGTYTVCFVDYMLGRRGGIDLIKAAVAEETTVPLILLTGSTDAVVDIEAAAAGATDFIAKGELSTKTLARALRFAAASQEKNRALLRHRREMQDAMLELEEQRALLQQAMDHTRHGIAMFDADHCLIACNAQYLRIYGFSSAVVRPGVPISEILGYSISIGNYSGEEAARIRAEREVQLTTPEHSTYEQRLRDGRTISVSHAPVAGGRSVTTCEDITDTLARQHRSAELARSAALSEAVITAKSKFLSNMSHELRTPLNAIKGFSDLILQEMFGPLGNDRYRAYVDDIGASADVLSRVIDQVLDTSLLHGGELQLTEKGFSLADTVIAAVDKHRAACVQKRIDLQPTIAVPGLRLHGDRAKISQAVESIVDNAVKFSLPEGKVTVSLSRDDQGAVAVRVTDTGPGIPEDRIEALFSPFEQDEAADNRRVHGAGLGLPIAHGLVRLHGGDVSINSTVGTGTTVTITLPAERVVTQNSGGRSRKAS